MEIGGETMMTMTTTNDLWRDKHTYVRPTHSYIINRRATGAPPARRFVKTLCVETHIGTVPHSVGRKRQLIEFIHKHNIADCESLSDAHTAYRLTTVIVR